MIDFHTHIFPEQIAERTISHLAGIIQKQPSTDGMKDGLLASMDASGIACSVVLPVVTKPSQFDSVNRYAAQFQDGRLISFGGIHPDDADYKAKLRFLKEQGFRGIKFHPDYQEVYFNDIRFKRIVECATELDLIVSVHAGIDPLSPKDVHCTPQMAAELIADVAPTKLVLAHLGGHLMYDDVERYLVGKHVYFDTGVMLDTIDETQLMRIVRTHGADHILFGTDAPWAGQKAYVKRMQELPFTEEERSLIFEENAKQLLGI
ncbi:MAG: amidohydrolase family protein [Faecalimonas sp.]|nr:amidohydrolase family protein [Faecalimonas sp.]